MHIVQTVWTDLTSPQGNCSSNVTSILGGLRNAGTGLSGTEITYIPGCSTTTCPETDFSDAVSAAAKAKLAVVVLGLLGWDMQQDGQNADPNAFEREGKRVFAPDITHNTTGTIRRTLRDRCHVRYRPRPYIHFATCKPVQACSRPGKEQRQDTSLVRDHLLWAPSQSRREEHC